VLGLGIGFFRALNKTSNSKLLLLPLETTWLYFVNYLKVSINIDAFFTNIMMEPDVLINAKLQNWNNFCLYHTGDWYGTWTIYSPDLKVKNKFKCLRSLHSTADGSEITHQNSYTYTDSKTEVKNFCPYQKPKRTALFLENSFSWGSTTVESNSVFGFETGFRYDDKRASAAILYD
jgi:hypothetical protein